MKRREFVSSAAAGSLGLMSFPAILRSASPNATLQVACIGVGGMGGATMRQVASHPRVKIVALCDVDADALAAAAKEHPDAAKFKDWRELLNEHSDTFDAVTIGTPDHMHAPPAVTALRAGKHVYLQKPMASTIHECRVIAEEAAKAGVTTQLGNQGRSSLENRTAVELIQVGAIGKIKEVVIWENKKLNWWPKNTQLRSQADRVPDGFDWDLWLGVRSPRPYLTETYHPKTWRAWFDFGVGELGDMGCHHFDTSFDALRLTAPLRVRQTTPGSQGPLWGMSRIVEFVFPGSEFTHGDTVQLTWHDGELRPRPGSIPLPPGVASLPDSGTLWVGEHGTIFKDYRQGFPIVMADGKSPNTKFEFGLKPQDHYHDWVDGVLAGRKSCADFSHGGPLTESVLVGAMADRFAGEWLTWDSPTKTFTDHAGATSLVQRDYRDGWQIPGLG